jgi:RNA polymerase sigma-70 factor (ECF subfamily)
MRDNPGFVDLYNSDFAIVFRAVFALFGDRALAEDCAQEAFAKALERWHRIGLEPWVGGWVMKTAINEARRSRKLRGVFHLRPSQTEEDFEAALDLRMALSTLSPRQQEATVLHYLGDFPLEQVASIMDCEVGTVKAHLWRARRILAKRMEADKSV